MKPKALLTITVLLVSGLTLAQDRSQQPIPQGSSLPGMASIPLGMNGPGFVELGGSYFNLTGTSPHWEDAYAKALISGGLNGISGEVSRQNRFGDTGWYYSFGWTRVWSENWYSELDFGTSTVDGFFLPKARVDALINRKVLPRKQLVLTLGAGYDRSKVGNFDYRGHLGATYYFSRPWIVQGGAIFTYARPGNILAPSGFLAVTHGHVKEHYITARANFGREGYEVINAGQTIVNFAFQDYSLNWRQWMAPNWGFSATAEYESKPVYHRAGGTIGLFLDF